MATQHVFFLLLTNGARQVARCFAEGADVRILKVASERNAAIHTNCNLDAVGLFEKHAGMSDGIEVSQAFVNVHSLVCAAIGKALKCAYLKGSGSSIPGKHSPRSLQKSRTHARVREYLP